MAVKQEIKSHLARLLATEDLVVEHKQCESAQFNVHTRVLTLPLWEKASNIVYDMLVGHEVGHALFTPDEDWTVDIKVPTQFLNVVEDARIEKLMKRKYMGLAKTFYNGYNELYDKDFFELDGEDITTFNLADRANLFFKIGSFVDLVFSTAEEQIISMIQKCETFEDVKKASLVLYDYCKEEQQSPQVSSPNNQDVDMDPDGGFFDDKEMSDEELLEELNKPLVKEKEEKKEELNEEEKEDKEPEVKTETSLSNKLESLVNTQGLENVYVEIPDVNIDAIIAKNGEVHEEIDNHWKYQQKEIEEWQEEYKFLSTELFNEVDAEYVKFKKDSQKEVSYLVKEFECRKAASSYARSSVSKTGVLDTTNLHTYKFNEDLFKKVTVLPDGKNHGLVFVLDWSGSMAYVMKDTLKQLYNLIWFCKKVNIPFEVYAFTTEWRRTRKNYETGGWTPVDMTPYYEKKENILRIEEEFSLLNLFTSDVKTPELEHQMINIWRLARYFCSACNYSCPPRLSLSGTPLNEALICLHKILPQFQKNNNLEKVQCIVLTDGEANTIPYHSMVHRRWEQKPRLGVRNLRPDRCFFRDRKLGKTYKLNYNWHHFTDVIINNLKDNFPLVNFIGIRVLAPRDANGFIKLYGDDEKVRKDWKKMRSFVIHNSGYDAYFGMASTSLAQEVEFDPGFMPTKAQIKSAFVKSLKTKKLNKKVLGEFISLVV